MLKVVIADDEKKICKLLQCLVDWKTLGFEIVGVVNDGETLKKEVAEKRPDLVVTDICMPGCSGIDFLHFVQENGIETEVLIVSGFRDFEYVREALHCGAADYLLKPLETETLETALKKIYGKQMQDLIDKEKLDSAVKIAGRNLIENILADRTVQMPRTEMAEHYQCRFTKKELYAIVIKINLHEYTTTDYWDEKILELIENIANASGTYFAASVHDHFIYILYDANDISDVEQDCYHMIYDIKNHMVNMNGGHLSVGVSVVKDDQLKKAFDIAKEASWELLFKGTERVFVLDEQDNSPPEVLFSDIRKELASAFQQTSTGQYQLTLNYALKEIDQCDKLKTRGRLYYNQILEVQRQIEYAVRKIFNDNEPQEISDVLTTIQRCLNGASKVGEFKRILNEEGERLNEIIARTRADIDKQPIREMKRVIANRYKEDLSLENLAECLGMSSSYVSRLIKKELGVNFTQYLNNVRIDKAKQLLEETGQSLAEIAEQVGYSDEKYFMRVFKRETGLTAKEYRRLYGG